MLIFIFNEFIYIYIYIYIYVIKWGNQFKKKKLNFYKKIFFFFPRDEDKFIFIHSWKIWIICLTRWNI